MFNEADILRVCNLMMYSEMKDIRIRFSHLSEDEFFLLWMAAKSFSRHDRSK